jgi:hypothetical protein
MEKGEEKTRAKPQKKNEEVGKVAIHESPAGALLGDCP